MSWHSSADYCRLINEQVAEQLGGHHSARCLLASLDFEEVRDFQRRDAWDEAGDYLATAARQLQTIGADLVVLAPISCTRRRQRSRRPSTFRSCTLPTPSAPRHRPPGTVASGFSAPAGGWRSRSTATGCSLAGASKSSSPTAKAASWSTGVIFDELTLGRIEDASRASYVRTIENLAERGATAVVLACTEIELLISDKDSPIPVVDSTQAHASAAVDLALASADPA